jgi:hypothetical protein
MNESRIFLLAAGRRETGQAAALKEKQVPAP